MSGLSRRTFLTRGSLAVAVGSVATAVPGLGSILEAAPAEAPEINGALTEAEAGAANAGGPLVAHVTDLQAGEISIYQGESQVVYKDPALVARLARAIPSQGR
ncbi:MAG: twin-arginine translocation signal domain-containing protein [Acidimicrobiaceae bacterium]|nr:twin-arginine translocation signal domain-containing protein [Acidimicrobiaceae bacterium]MBO0747031.1 twin-arginine translocation signal domain-containing protein [Acidimicrobiaceae bacterium]